MKKRLLCAALLVFSGNVMTMDLGPAEQQREVHDWLPCMFRQKTSDVALVERGRIGFGHVNDAPIKAAKIKNRAGHSDSEIVFGQKHVLFSDDELSAFARKSALLHGKSEKVSLVTEKSVVKNSVSKVSFKNWTCLVKDIQETVQLRLNENLKPSRLHIVQQPDLQGVANQQKATDPQACLQLTWLGKVVVFLQHGDKKQTLTLPEQALNLLQTRLESSKDGIEMGVQKGQQFVPGQYADKPAVADKFFIKKSDASVIASQPQYIFWRNIIAGGGATVLALFAAAYAYFHSK